MPLEKQSLGLFTHPFRYCRDNPHPPRSDSQFQQGMPQYLCRTGVPTAIHAGEEINWDAQMVIFQQCHEGTLNYSCSTAWIGLKLWQKARSLPVQTQLTKQPVIHYIFDPGNKALWIQECFLKSSPTYPIIPQIFSHNLRTEKVVPYCTGLISCRQSATKEWPQISPGKLVFQSLGILCFTPLPKLWKSIGITWNHHPGGMEHKIWIYFKKHTNQCVNFGGRERERQIYIYI